MKRIMIIGCPGSGKTTLARTLAAQLDLPLVHLDALYWTGHLETVSKETFHDLLLQNLQKEKWIIYK